MKFPSKFALRDERRRLAEEKYAEQQARFKELEQQNNPVKYVILKQVRSLSDTDETVMVIVEALTYLLERAND